MKKCTRKNKCTAVLSAVFGFGAAMCLSAGIFSVGAAEKGVFQTVSPIEEYYEIGSTFEVPQATFSLGGENLRAQFVVYDPDREIITDRTFSLDKKGEYRVSYSAVVDGKNYSENYSFQSARLTENVFSNPSNARTEMQASLPDYFGSDAEGIRITATSDGGSVDYSEVIDLRYNTKEDLLLSLAVAPEVKNTEELYQITITLTDIYDLTNTVKIVTYRGSWSNQYCFTRAAATRQTLAGLDGEEVKTEYRMGAGVSHSFAGNNLAGCDRIEYYFDYAERALYVSPSTDSVTGGLVIDFDDPRYIADTLLWDGFTTGEVRMNISLQKLQTTPASIVVLNVNGNDLGGEVLPDGEGPVFDFSFGEYEEENLPHALAGKAYPLFPATAYDRVDGSIADADVSAEIYSVAEDGERTPVASGKESFTPETAGLYYVEYTASDKSGNAGKDGYYIRAEESLPPIALAEEYEVPASAYVGESFELPVFEVTGGSGQVRFGWTVTDGSGSVLGEDLPRVECASAGRYTVLLTAEDYIGQTFEKTYTVDVTVKQSPVIEVGYVPEYLISGVPYTFEDFSATDYYTQDSPTEAEKSIVVEYNGKTETLADDYTFTPVLEGNADEMTVRFCAVSADGRYSDEKVYTVRLVDGVSGSGTVDFTRFFAAENAAVQAGAENVEVTFSEDARVKYVNPFVANGVRATFDVIPEKNDFGRIDIYLTDSVEPSVQILLSIYKNTADTVQSRLAVNGGEPIYAVAGSFFGNTRSHFDLSFSMDTLYLMDRSGGSVITSVTETLSGRTFTGFPSRRCYVTFLFAEVNGESAVDIYTLGNNTFNDVGTDYAAPVLDLTKEIPSEVHFGEEIVVPWAVAADAVDPSVSVTVTVTCGDAVLIDGADITREDLSVTVDSYSPYRIRYQTEDMFGRSTSRTYTVYPLDEETPVLQVEWELTQAERGSTHSLPVASVTDNNEKDLTAKVFVQYPSGAYRLYAGNEITFEEAGRYLIRYFVWDESGNFAYRDFVIEVS